VLPLSADTTASERVQETRPGVPLKRLCARNRVDPVLRTGAGTRRAKHKSKAANGAPATPASSNGTWDGDVRSSAWVPRRARLASRRPAQRVPQVSDMHLLEPAHHLCCQLARGAKSPSSPKGPASCSIDRPAFFETPIRPDTVHLPPVNRNLPNSNALQPPPYSKTRLHTAALSSSRCC
jgi:hypothetical protein